MVIRLQKVMLSMPISYVLTAHPLSIEDLECSLEVMLARPDLTSDTTVQVSFLL